MLGCLQAVRVTLEIEPDITGSSLASGVLSHARMDEKPSVEASQQLHCSLGICFPSCFWHLAAFMFHSCEHM